MTRQMTPQEYVDRVTELVRTDQDEAALGFASRFGRHTAPHLTAQQLVFVGDLLEGAQLALDFKRAARARSVRRDRSPTRPIRKPTAAAEIPIG